MNIEQAITELHKMSERRELLEKAVLFVKDPNEKVHTTLSCRFGYVNSLDISRDELAHILQREIGDITARQGELQPIVDLANVALRGVAS